MEPQLHPDSDLSTKTTHALPLLPLISRQPSNTQSGQCFFFTVMCYTYRLFPSRDRQKIDFLKKIFWFMIVESKTGLEGQEAFFEFKYVPEFATLTEMDESGEAKETVRGVEWRNLKWAVFMVGSVAVVGYCTVKAVGMAWGMVWR